jgi:hypothetical protein
VGRIPSAPTTTAQGGGGNPQAPSGKPPGAHPNSPGKQLQPVETTWLVCRIHCPVSPCYLICIRASAPPPWSCHLPPTPRLSALPGATRACWHGQQQKGNPLTALPVLSVLSVLQFHPHGAPVCAIRAIRAPRQAPHLVTTTTTTARLPSVLFATDRGPDKSQKHGHGQQPYLVVHPHTLSVNSPIRGLCAHRGE